MAQQNIQPLTQGNASKIYPLPNSLCDHLRTVTLVRAPAVGLSVNLMTI